MRMIPTTMALAAVIAMTGVPQAAETIGRSNPLRKELLNSLRPYVENDLGVDVQFVVDTLQVEDGYAFLAGSVQHKDGSPIDFSQTPYADAEAEGMFDGPSIRALLSKQGDDWQAEIFSIGATDVVEAGWPDEFGVSCTLVNACY